MNIYVPRKKKEEAKITQRVSLGTHAENDNKYMDTYSLSHSPSPCSFLTSSPSHLDYWQDTVPVWWYICRGLSFRVGQAPQLTLCESVHFKIFSLIMFHCANSCCGFSTLKATNITYYNPWQSYLGFEWHFSVVKIKKIYLLLKGKLQRRPLLASVDLAHILKRINRLLHHQILKVNK